MGRTLRVAGHAPVGPVLTLARPVVPVVPTVIRPLTLPPVLTLTLALSTLALPAARGDGAAAPAPFPAGYLGHEALTAALKKAAEAHPERVQVQSLARSFGERDVWLVTLGADPARRKPAVLVVANLEADHAVGSHVALGLVEALAGASGPDAAWLDRLTLYVVPRLNPDGAERALGRSPAPIRGNLRPLDRDRDGHPNEDGPDDLNGDGLLTTLRVKDPLTATLLPDAKDPRVLRKADPAKGERAVYAEEPEGIDNDGDGLRNEDPPSGVNLNRNWPHKWAEFDPETGFSPASEPEVLGLIRFAFDHPEIVAVWSFGLNDNLRDEPKKPASTLDDADLPLFAELSRAFARLNAPKGSKDKEKEPEKGKAEGDKPKAGNPAGKGTPAPGATTDGALSEWAYHQFGVVGLASRLWPTPEIPAPAPGPEPRPTEAKAKDAAPAVPEDGEARWLYWNDKVMGGRAFVPFAPFDHPTLGKVEIGGWKPGVRLNPPIADLPALTATHLAFLKVLGDHLPRLAVPQAKAVARGGGLFEVTATVENAGDWPTALAQGVKTRKAPPVLVRLLPGEGVKLLTGKALQRLDTLGGAGARREFRWLIQAPGGTGSVKVEAACPKAGRVEVTVPLEGK